jgi:hypothetical protein
MSRYIKYVREVDEFGSNEEVQEYLDSIIERGYEIVHYEETRVIPEYLKITVVIGKLNVY